jgi:hypothetical protein
MARRYARLGETDRAMLALDAAYRERSYTLVFLTVDHLLAPLRPDPRFRALAELVGVPQPHSPIPPAQ